jgi:hypothetical protein
MALFSALEAGVESSNASCVSKRVYTGTIAPRKVVSMKAPIIRLRPSGRQSHTPIARPPP